MSFKVSIELSDKDVSDMLIAGFEHSGYGHVRVVNYDCPADEPEWAKGDFKLPFYAWAPLCTGGFVRVRDVHGDGNEGVINRESLQAALDKMAKLYPRNFTRLVCGDYDVIDGDVLLQMAAFGEWMYA
jgi:hypothetical protein